MKSFTDTSFFLLFEQILRSDNPGLKLDRWSKHGINWERTKHSYTGSAYGFILDSFLAVRSGRNAWSLLILKEHWWAGSHGDAVKSQQWAKPLTGQRRHIFGWFAERKASLDLEHPRTK